MDPSGSTTSLAPDQDFVCLFCQGHGSSSRVTFCSTCKDYYCDDCWLKQPLHRPGRANAGASHEKVELELYWRLFKTFNPDPRKQDELHREDVETTWFGVKRDADNQQKILLDSGRYASLVANGSEGRHLVRFPSIVSFVGQTGAGKSTLLKILIERQFPWLADEIDRTACEKMFPVPVCGDSSTGKVPTSGDVHLYSDPSTYFNQSPTFFVDSEGLGGGSVDPIALRHKEQDRATNSKIKFGRNTKNRLTKTKIWRFSREVSRPIAWMDAPEREKREFAVTHFYPRILYTFSDTIVFVLREARTFESAVVTRLVDWASEVLNASTNQPRLPHAIIVLNAANARTDPREWDVEYATNTLLDTVTAAIPTAKESDRIQKLIKHWNLPEKPVRNLRDLLLCYYSSVRVVYVPDDSQYLKMEEQVGKLYGEIQSSCQASHQSKRMARMLMNADELDELFQSAFEHFSRTLDAPFDLVEAARKNTAIPRDFSGNVTKLAEAVTGILQKKKSAQDGKKRANWRLDSGSDTPRIGVKEIFEPLSLMVASSVFLECSRGNWKGSAMEFFEKNYQEPCIKAVQVFSQQCWPCEYEFEGRKGRCVNTLARHQKGHQLSGRYPRQQPGDYYAVLPLHDLLPLWLKWIYNWIAHFQAWLKTQTTRDSARNTTEEDLVAQMHQHNMHKFYEQVEGSLSYISHSVCLCCLRALPEHPLQCGHVLCTPCVKTYGNLELRLAGLTSIQHGQVSLNRCPLHSPNKKGFEVTEPRTIQVKPEGAGVRILCLDGGGIRGIVELEVLRYLERYLGGELPIQSFFDLIVGTSTGGIIAAGLGIEGWRVDDCIEHFMNLTDKAFTKRRFGVHELPVLNKAVRKYRAKPFEEVLKQLFGEDEYMFGGFQADPKRYAIRTAVTATTATGSTAVVLSNYNRPEDSPFTEFVRPDRPEHELKIWEAIRSTTAAPGFFKAFVKKETNQRFVDGAVYHNCPAFVAFEESRLIWPDVRHCLPDIMLSLGTGHNRSRTHQPRAMGSDGAGGARPPEVRRSSIARTQNADTSSSQGYEVLQNVRMILARMSNVLNSQLMWDTFRRDRLLTTPRDEIPAVLQRFQRIDPYLGYEPPRLDDKAKMKQLRSTVSSQLEHDSLYRRKIRNVAHRLVASCFYFEKFTHATIGNGWYEFDGRILCRFANNTQALSHLGEFLIDHRNQTVNGRGRPYLFFRVTEVGRRSRTTDIELTQEVLHRMAKGMLSIFDMNKITGRVTNKNADVLVSLVFWDSEATTDDVVPISGFPRKIVAESSQASVANLAPTTPKVSADEYWKDLSTDVEPEIAIVNSDTWATDLEESLNNSLGIIQEEKEEEAATWQDRWANKRQAFFGGGSSSDSRLQRLFPSLANLRSKSRSPNGSERDNTSDMGASPGQGTTPISPTRLTVPDDEFRPPPNTLSPPLGGHFSAKSSEYLIDLSTPTPSTIPLPAYITDLDDIEFDPDQQELNRAIEESIAGSGVLTDRSASPTGRGTLRSYFQRQHAHNASSSSTRRHTARDTDLVERERALALRLLEGGYQPNYIDDTGDDPTPDGEPGEGNSGGGARLDSEGPESCWYFPG
ncbi:hypothetical protein V8F06_012271 [Rhypophila decipiens]